MTYILDEFLVNGMKKYLSDSVSFLLNRFQTSVMSLSLVSVPFPVSWLPWLQDYTSWAFVLSTTGLFYFLRRIMEGFQQTSKNKERTALK